MVLLLELVQQRRVVEQRRRTVTNFKMGICWLEVAGSGVGIGIIFGSLITGVAGNPKLTKHNK